MISYHGKKKADSDGGKADGESVRSEALDQDVCGGEIPRQAGEVDLRPSRTPRRHRVGPARLPSTLLSVPSLCEEL